MSATTVDGLDATDQARLVAEGEVTPRQLVEHALARIEALNPSINAVIWSDPEAALTAADQVEAALTAADQVEAALTAADQVEAALTAADQLGASSPGSGPLAGVPFLIKDIGATQAGLPHWMGNRALKDADHRRTSDTELGARFRSAGLITVGKTNLPELGSSPTTQPLSCGPTNNPWDLTRSPAGSSGGSAAAVAAGMVAIAHANDGGGSTRLPAAWCGLVGLKTSRGRMPAPEDTSRLLSELVVTRTVRDTALALDALAGATEADLYQLAPPDRPFREFLRRDLPPLRIGLITDGGNWEVDADCVVAAKRVAGLLEQLGHHIEPVGAEVLLGGDSLVNNRLWMSGLARRVEALGEKLGRPLTADEVEPYNWTAAMRGVDLPATELAAALERQQLWSKSVVEWFGDFDLLVTPTSGAVPMKTADLVPPADKPWKIGPTYGKIGAFTLPFNVTGQPAVSVPVHWTDDGLPVGTQLVAHLGREDLLLTLAADLERAAPWHERYSQLTAPDG
jgi:amidase